MEKDDTLIGLVVVALIVLVALAIVDTLDTKTDDIPADSQWNSGNDLLETLWLPVLVAIIIGVVWVLFKNGIGGGGV